MTNQRGSRNEFRAIRGLLADAALDRALIGLGRLDLALKNWETQPRAPAGQSDGGRWVTGPGGVPLKLPPTSWSSLRDGESGADQEPSRQTGSITLDDGNRVLWLKIRDRRGQIEEQHAVIAPSGESRIFKDFGNIQTVIDGETGKTLSSSYFTPNVIESSPIFQPAYSPDEPKRASRSLLTFQLAISLLEFLSRK
jgi:hypothetical protein